LEQRTGSDVDVDLWLEIVVQLCRMQVQRDRERLMTSKLRGALDSLKKFQHDAEYEAERLVNRIETEGRPLLDQGVRAAHGSLDAMHGAVTDIIDFAEELRTSNGGELGNSGEGSETQSPPRSSEVASR
jgi:hypothetical protein